ncbi:MAG: hypothetical protein LBU58_03045 [Clostridiales bacterium]|jgi:hypothetical protein|nr:hypothetical protein [Clostridiales bacterium]
MDIMEKAIATYEAELDYAHFRGMEAGMDAGMEKAARNLLAENTALDLIQKVTGLSIETIEHLKTQIN